jgi:hypothetical protein
MADADSSLHSASLFAKFCRDGHSTTGTSEDCLLLGIATGAVLGWAHAAAAGAGLSAS